MAAKKTKVRDQSPPPVPSGLRMPAEWEPHAATWLAWPHQASDWPGKLAPIPWVYCEIVRLLHPHERVNIIVKDTKQQKAATAALTKAGVDFNQITFWAYPTDRVWTRDYGPIFVYDAKGTKGFLNWRFNAWAKYDNWKYDDAIPGHIAKATGLPNWQPVCRGERVVLEGGSIDVSGDGLLLTTEECLLSKVQARNPAMKQTDYEQVFAEYLGIKKVLWLGKGIVGDDTHGHIDDLARFVAPRKIVCVVEDDPSDENYAPLQANFDRLSSITDAEGKPFEVVPLPMPAPVYFRGQRLPASYANFYIANGIVLVPTFNDPNDRKALNTLAEVFPDRTVVGVHSVDLVWGFGTLHCMTQQEPA
jgi:agmatine deiminase